MAYFRITLLRSAIGLPRSTTGILNALGLKKRLRTVYHPVSPSVAGQIFAVKELVDVQEVDEALSNEELKALRRPEPGFYIEKRVKEIQNDAVASTRKRRSVGSSGGAHSVNVSDEPRLKGARVQLKRNKADVLKEGEDWTPTWTPADAKTSPAEPQPEAKA